jgi:acetyl-CoA acetyltransferase
MRDVYIIGVGMTKFGKLLERSMKSLAAEAIDQVLSDAGVRKEEIQAAFVGNAAQGLITGQECVRGQVVLREYGIGGIPIVNVENACASSSTAMHLAWQAVAGGIQDCVLALGMEKLYSQDKARTFATFGAAVDVEFLDAIRQALAAQEPEASRAVGARADFDARSGTKPGKAGGEGGSGGKRSMFMDFYAMAARDHMRRYGTTVEQFACVAAKNSYHGSLNPLAQYREAKSVEEVLASPVVAEPLTRLMCAPIGDGAAALLVASSAFIESRLVRGLPVSPVRVAASVLRSGRDRQEGDPSPVTEAARLAYEQADLRPDEIDLAEVHDATAPAEIMIMEELGFCAPGEAGKLVEEGETRIGGRIPINTSGGLIARGHPVGATGAAQLHELVQQIRGRCGPRQVAGARVGLAENAGGAVRAEPAAIAVHILTAA